MSGHCLQLFEIGKVSMKIHVAKTVPSFHTLPLQTIPDLYFSLQYSVKFLTDLTILTHFLTLFTTV